MSICIITWPIRGSRTGIIFVNEFTNIMSAVFKHIILITQIDENLKIEGGMKVNLIRVKMNFPTGNLLSKTIYDLLYQFKVCLLLIRTRNAYNYILIYGGSTLILPKLISLLLKKPLFINILGSESKRINSVYRTPWGAFIAKILRLFEIFDCIIAKNVIVESENMIKFLGLESYKEKIKVSARYINFDRFTIIKDFKERLECIGYIGRLSPEKGIRELMEAIHVLKNKEKNPVNIAIAGDGPLSQEVINEIKKISEKNVHFLGWIPENDLPVFLNNLKLLILPSYTEGLPTILLESMACGTPVLATNIAGIPDLIKDGKTGFILKDNYPTTIVEGIVRALNSYDLEEISGKASMFIKENYSLDQAISRYSKIFQDINFEEL